MERLLEYVKDKYREKNCKGLDGTEWELVSCMRDTPQQRNGEFVFLVRDCAWLVSRFYFAFFLLTYFSLI